MSKDACRPFSANRNGMVQGEGAGVFVFEEYEHAKKRGAEMLAEVVGFSMTSDASDIVMPSQKGAARAIAGALKDAKINADQVGYINAHGTGTAANDKTECAAVASVFRKHADQVDDFVHQIHARALDRWHRRSRTDGLPDGTSRRHHRPNHWL